MIGSEANGYHSWIGTLFTVAFFGDAFPDSSMNGPEDLILSKKPLLLFQFNEINNGSIRSTGSDTVTTLNIPEHFIPYKRNFLMESTTAFWTRRIYFRDVIFNVIMFVPIGFLVSVLSFRKILKPFLIMIVTVASGFLFSLTIELLQAFLPERNSSITDVFSNMLGTTAGFVLCMFVSKMEKSRIDVIP